MFFEEVTRTEGSHDEKNRPRSPPSVNRALGRAPTAILSILYYVTSVRFCCHGGGIMNIMRARHQPGDREELGTLPREFSDVWQH